MEEHFNCTRIRGGFLTWEIDVSFPNGKGCTITGSPYAIKGSFMYDGRFCEFREGQLKIDGSPFVGFSYSRGTMGIGHCLSFNGMDGEFIFALRPTDKMFDRRMILSGGNAVLAEIENPWFSQRPSITRMPTASIASEVLLLCLWVATVKMQG